MVQRVMVALAACVLLFGVPAAAEEAPAVEPALEPDPAVMERLDGLGERSAVVLPPINTVGEWNEVTRRFRMEQTGPQGRDYCIKAVWMPDRERAFFCGANHGSPHRLNDAWEYDLPSNTWVLLFAPDPNNARGVMEVKTFTYKGADGEEKETAFVQTERGGPTHYGHTWWGLAYDPEMRAALWMNVAIGGSAHAYVREQVGEDGEAYSGPALWAFYPYERRWAPVLTDPPRPRTIYAGAMEYVPEHGGAFWYMAQWNGQGMWVYQHESNTWRDLKPNDGANLYHNTETPRAEAVMAYDEANKVVVAVFGKNTYHYDVEANTWSRVIAGEDDDDSLPSGHDARTPFGYDPAAGVCLLYSAQTPDHMWSYSVTERAWTKHEVDGPAGPSRRLIGYHDPARNVFVVNAGATTWCYRHTVEE